MKKITACVLVLLLTFAAFAACAPQEKIESDELNVVCTIFPQYDWCRNIVGEIAGVELTLLLNNRADLHNYQPSVDDVMKISSCDLFVYVGGESDSWVSDALKESTNPDMLTINLLELLGENVKQEEIKDGMQEDDDHDNDEHEAENDEHVWLSLGNAKKFCDAIADSLSALDNENAEFYNNNLNAYKTKLDALDERYKAAVDAAAFRTLLFGDRFPFRYLTDDYGLDYYAAFPGCSAETEAKFDTIIDLATKIDQLNLKSVLVTESSDCSIAEAIVGNTKNRNQQILVLDSMQSVAKNNIEAGVSYLSIMESNLEILKEALKG